MAFQLQYQSEPKTVVLNHLRQNPSHEYDDFRRYCRGSRNVPRHVFKEVKADMQLKGLMPIIPGDKAYKIVRREVEQELKAKQQEEVIAAPAPIISTSAPAPEPAQISAPAVKAMELDSTPRIDRKRYKVESLTTEQTIQIENLFLEMPDLMPAEVVQFMKIPTLTTPIAAKIKSIVKSHLESQGNTTMPKATANNSAIYERIASNLSTISKADVLSLTSRAYQDRFKHSLPNHWMFNTGRSKYLNSLQGNGRAPRAAQAPSMNGNGNGHHQEPRGPILAPGVVICKIDDAKYAESERRTLRNLMPEAIREALRTFGITCPPMSTALVELDDETKVLEFRIKAV